MPGRGRAPGAGPLSSSMFEHLSIATGMWMPPEARRQVEGPHCCCTLQPDVCWCQVEGELQALGLSQEAAKGVLSLTHMGSLEELEAALPGHEACRELRRLFELAEVRCLGPRLDPPCKQGLWAAACCHSLW